MMAEIYGKKTGYCKGKGGSMHIADFSIGMLGATRHSLCGPPHSGRPLRWLPNWRVETECGSLFLVTGATNEGAFP